MIFQTAHLSNKCRSLFGRSVLSEAGLMAAAVALRTRSAATLFRLLLPVASTSGFALRPPVARLATDATEATKKRHVLLTFGFTGTGYYGLQSQRSEGDPERPTVSDVVRQALLKQGFILESNFVPLERTRWRLASRTDKGVHAVCAAASVKIETRSDDVSLADIPDSDIGDDAASADAEFRGALHATGLDWELSPKALDRINSALPTAVRVFSGSKVRKSFDAREDASSRTYEYLLPASAIGASVDDLDGVLQCFEGTHRFHNFASGLRKRTDAEESFTCEASGISWPLALGSNEHQSAAFRSVRCTPPCRW